MSRSASASTGSEMGIVASEEGSSSCGSLASTSTEAGMDEVKTLISRGG